MKSVRRKRVLVDPRFQAIFAIYATVATLIMVPIFIATNLYFFKLFSEKVARLGLPPDHELIQFADRQQTLMVVLFIVATIIALFINLVASYYFSHRIAGSMQRLRSAMSQAPDFNSAEPIVPRKKDFFQDVTEAYNQLLQRSRN